MCGLQPPFIALFDVLEEELRRMLHFLIVFAESVLISSSSTSILLTDISAVEGCVDNRVANASSRSLHMSSSSLSKTGDLYSLKVIFLDSSDLLPPNTW